MKIIIAWIQLWCMDNWKQLKHTRLSLSSLFRMRMMRERREERGEKSWSVKVKKWMESLIGSHHLTIYWTCRDFILIGREKKKLNWGEDELGRYYWRNLNWSALSLVQRFIFNKRKRVSRHEFSWLKRFVRISVPVFHFSLF